MIDKIKKFIEDVRTVWEAARKPTTEEIKRILYTTFLIFFLITIISLAIFITVQYLLYLWQFTL